MSDQRRFRWNSGRLGRGPIQDFWQLTRTVQDPQVPNLPLETPAGAPPVVHDPPPRSHVWLPHVIGSWTPVFALPPESRGRYLEPPVLAVALPASSRQWLATVLAAWNQSPSIPDRRQLFVPPTARVPDGARRWLAQVLASWEPPDGRLWQRPLPHIYPDKVPPLSRLWITPVLAAWDRKDAQPPRQLVQATTLFPPQFAGLRTFYSAAVQELSLVALGDAPTGMGGQIVIDKNGTLYAVYLVDVGDANASNVYVYTTTGIKAIRLKT